MSDQEVITELRAIRQLLEQMSKASSLEVRLEALENRVDKIPRKATIGAEKVRYIEDQLRDLTHRTHELEMQLGESSPIGVLDADVLAVGMSKSARDKTRLMIDLIRELTTEHQGAAPIESILDRAETKLGMERHKAGEILARLRMNGEIFEFPQGFMKLP